MGQTGHRLGPWWLAVVGLALLLPAAGLAYAPVGGFSATKNQEPPTKNLLLPVSDHVGTIHALVAVVTNSLALPEPCVVATYCYSPYGELVERDGPFAASNPFGFQSKYYDAETGFWYYGYRYYDAKAGKWLTSDPLQEAGGLNLTAFCGNDPVNSIDPLGLATWEGTLDIYLSKYGDKGLLLLQLFLADYTEDQDQKPGVAVGSTGWFFPRAAKIDDATKVAILSAAASDESAAKKLHSLLTSRYDTTAARLERGIINTTRGSGALVEVFEAIDEANRIPANSDAQQEWLSTLAKASRRASEMQNDVRDEIAWTVASFVGCKTAEAALDALKEVRLIRLARMQRFALPEAAGYNPWTGELRSVVTETDTVMYRVWGDNSDRLGGWLVPTKPRSTLVSIREMALPPGNSAEYYSEVLVPAGTRYQIGTAASAFGQPGGATQVLLLDMLPASSFGPGIPLAPWLH